MGNSTLIYKLKLQIHGMAQGEWNIATGSLSKLPAECVADAIKFRKWLKKVVWIPSRIRFWICSGYNLDLGKRASSISSGGTSICSEWRESPRCHTPLFFLGPISLDNCISPHWKRKILRIGIAKKQWILLRIRRLSWSAITVRNHDISKRLFRNFMVVLLKVEEVVLVVLPGLGLITLQALIKLLLWALLILTGELLEGKNWKPSIVEVTTGTIQGNGNAWIQGSQQPSRTK